MAPLKSAANSKWCLTAKPGGDLKKVEMAANEELQNLLKNGPTQAELDLAKTQIFGDYSREVGTHRRVRRKERHSGALPDVHGKPGLLQNLS